jgi:hypothetical protein
MAGYNHSPKYMYANGTVHHKIRRVLGQPCSNLTNVWEFLSRFFSNPHFRVSSKSSIQHSRGKRLTEFSSSLSQYHSYTHTRRHPEASHLWCQAETNMPGPKSQRTLMAFRTGLLHCQFGTTEPITMRHKLTILIPLFIGLLSATP